MRKLCLLCFLLILITSSGVAVAQDVPSSFRLTYQIGRGHIQSVEWNPTDDVILVSTIRGAWFYDSLLRDLGHIEAARLATFSPDGALVAGVDAENQITLWDGNTYASVGVLPGHEVLVTAIAWSANGEWLATVDRARNLIIWNVAQQNAISNWRIPEMTETLRWQPAGKMLAILATDTTVQVYDALHAQLIFRMSPVTCCGENPSVDIAWVDKNTLARVVVGDGNKAEQWNIETGELQSESWPKVDAETWFPNAYTRDKALTARGHFGEVDIFDSSTGEQISQFEDVLWYVTHLAWNSNSTRLVAAGAYSELYLWDISTTSLLAENKVHAKPEPRPASRMQLGDPNIAGLPSWSSDSQLLAIPDRATAVSIWDIAAGKQIALLEGYDAPVIKAAWHPEKNWLATINDCLFYSDDYSVQIWDGRTGDRIDSYSHDDCPRSAAWRPNDQILISVSNAQGELFVWDVVQRRLVERLAVEPYDPNLEIGIQSFEGMNWSPDGRYIVLTYIGGAGPVTSVYDYPELSRSPSFARCFLSHSGDVSLIFSRAYWSRDSRYCIDLSWYPAWAVDSFRDSIEGDPFGVSVSVLPDTQPNDLDSITLHGHSAPIVDVAPDPSGTNLLTISDDNEARLWDVFTGETLLVLSDVSRVAWSPDGTLIGGFSVVDQLWHIYDVQNGAVTATLPVPSFEAGYLVWSPDSQKIAQVVDGVVFIWER